MAGRTTATTALEMFSLHHNRARRYWLDAAREAQRHGVPMTRIAEAMGVTVTEAERLGEESER
jgi:hypothetical protein